MPLGAPEEALPVDVPVAVLVEEGDGGVDAEPEALIDGDSVVEEDAETLVEVLLVEVPVAVLVLVSEPVGDPVTVVDTDTVVVTVAVTDVVDVGVIVLVLVEDGVAEADSDTEALAVTLAEGEADRDSEALEVAVAAGVEVVDTEAEGVAETGGVLDREEAPDTDTEGVRDVVVLGVAEVDHVGDVVPSVTTGRVSVPA